MSTYRSSFRSAFEKAFTPAFLSSESPEWTFGLTNKLRNLPLLTDRYDDSGYNAHATLDRNSGSTIQDYLGNTVVILAHEFGFTGARRVDHADGIDYGAGALGIQYFDTEPDGTPLTTLKGVQIWEGSTNEFYDSANPATQNITTTAQDYTVSIKGTGDITLTGTATGTATESSPLTVTATAGTLTCTVNGTVTEPQVEAKGYKTPYIPTPVGASATRLADNCQVPWPSLVNDFVLGCEAVFGEPRFASAFYMPTTVVSYLRRDTSNDLQVRIGDTQTTIFGAFVEGDSSEYKIRKSATQGETTFVDGTEVDDNPTFLTDISSASALYIGQGNIANQLNGNLKNIILVSGDLSDSEVVALP